MRFNQVFVWSYLVDKIKQTVCVCVCVTHYATYYMTLLPVDWQQCREACNRECNNEMRTCQWKEEPRCQYPQHLEMHLIL